jgi:hypothetical protein
MDKDQLKQRTKKFALDIIKFVEPLPKGKAAEIIGRQLLRSGHLSALIIGPHAGRGLLRILSQKWELKKKNSMSQYIGRSCWWIPASYHMRELPCSRRKLMNY